MWVYLLQSITMLITKKHKEVHPIMYVLMVLFILYFVFVRLDIKEAGT